MIDALFHSTSGGRTADASEVFGEAVPYLVSVDDPYELALAVQPLGADRRSPRRRSARGSAARAGARR